MNLARFEWLGIATRGIASGKERSEVYDELYDHIEDHMDALLAAGFSKKEAEDRAISAMGDPYEVGKQLRRVHQPVLTWILRISKAVLACALTLWLLYAWVNQPLEELLLDSCYETHPVGSIDLSQEDLLSAVPPEEHIASYRRSKDTFQQVQLGDCLFTVSRYAVSQVDWYIGGSRHPWLVTLQLEIAPEHFWQRPWVQGNFTMVNDQGVEATPPDERGHRAHRRPSVPGGTNLYPRADRRFPHRQPVGGCDLYRRGEHLYPPHRSGRRDGL